MSTNRIFLLSPAHCGGKRAGMLFHEKARFALARRLREPGGATIGEVFSFLSGLYFRGKLAYSREFSNPPACAAGAYAITSTRGLVPVDTAITLNDLRDLGAVDIDAQDDRYRKPLLRDARRLDRQLVNGCEVVLLGSIATGKYVDVLLECFEARLGFPSEFIGRGDMSRGGLMLRCVQEKRELNYVPVLGSIRHGTRPPRLTPKPGILAGFCSPSPLA